MEQRILKKTDLKVSAIALGTADYGTKYTEEISFAQMDAFLEAGGNFIDTANVYGSWVADMGNISERVIGNWMESRKCRHQVIISTKGVHPDVATMHISRVYPEEIRKDLKDSLKGLKTDYIDLYFLHRDNPMVPAVEILGCLEEEVKKGNIRYYGCSNWRLPRILEAQQAARQEGLKGFVCNQLMYSLATTDDENLGDPTLVSMNPETYENHMEQDWNVMAYSAAAQGYLIKKMRGLSMGPFTAAAYGTKTNESFIEYLSDLEKEGYDPYRVCLNYLIQQELLTIPILSFSRMDQLTAAIKSCSQKLPEEVLVQLERIRKQERM